MRLLAALFVLVPVSALSQSLEPAAAPSPAPAAVEAPAPTVAPVAPRPKWSIGAGVAADRTVIITSPGLIAVSTAPELTASVERRLSGSTWLVLGAAGSFTRFDQDSAGYTDARLAVKGGVRRLLTQEGALADVSLTVLGMARGSWGDMDLGPSPSSEATGWGLGAELGLAVERELRDGLSLRVATPLMNASWDWQRTKTSGAEAVSASSIAADVAIAPRLELRLAF